MAPPPDTITLWIEFQCGFGGSGGTNIHSVAIYMVKLAELQGQIDNCIIIGVLTHLSII